LFLGDVAGGIAIIADMSKSASPDWCVYLLECNDGTFYCGTTTDIERRLKQHNDGKGARYTRPRRPVRLVAKSLPMTKREALSKEAFVKRRPKQFKKSLVMAEE